MDYVPNLQLQRDLLFIMKDLNSGEINFIEAYVQMFHVLKQDLELNLYYKLVLHMCVSTLLFIVFAVDVLTFFKNSLISLGNFLHLASKVEKARTL